MSIKSILNSSLKVDDSNLKENQYQEIHNHISENQSEYIYFCRFELLLKN